MPEQEYLPPHPPGGPDGPGPPGEVPPPWANLSQVRPARPRPGGLADDPEDGARPGGRGSPGYPMGSWPTAGPARPQDPVPFADGRPRQEQVPAWAGPDSGDEEAAASPPRAGPWWQTGLRHARRSHALLAGTVCCHPNHQTTSSRAMSGANNSALCAPTRRKPVQKAAHAAPKAGMSDALKTYPP